MRKHPATMIGLAAFCCCQISYVLISLFQIHLQYSEDTLYSVMKTLTFLHNHCLISHTLPPSSLSSTPFLVSFSFIRFTTLAKKSFKHIPISTLSFLKSYIHHIDSLYPQASTPNSILI